MNIFYLDPDPKLAAQYQCDRHVVKMTLETAQLLCSAYPMGDAPYKTTPYNHPCAVWTRQSAENYIWLLEHGAALASEYTARYGKTHKSSEVIEWCATNALRVCFTGKGWNEPPQCMPGEYQRYHTVRAYRAYYRGAKKSFATWKPPAEVPAWWTETP